MNIGSVSQPTDFALDVLGRYVCNTFDEALANSDAPYRSNASDLKGNPLPPRGDMRPFDFIVIGGGTFGGAVAEQLFYRSTGRNERILVLEGGPFLLPEHWQNLPSMSLGGEVWGVPWNSNTNDFQGLAFCIGGRSIFWGGWSPRLLDSETVTWPQAVLDDLNAKKLANGDSGYFRQSGQQIGVTETNDYHFRRPAQCSARCALRRDRKRQGKRRDETLDAAGGAPGRNSRCRADAGRSRSDARDSTAESVARGHGKAREGPAQ